MSRTLRTAASGAVLLALALGVAACGEDDDKPLATGPSSAPSSPSMTQSPGASNGPGSSLSPAPGLPADFPTAAIPLLPGPASQPLGEGSSDEGKRGWFVEVRVDQKFEPCFEAAQSELVARGFVKQPGELRDAANWQVQFIGSTYAVILSTSPTDEGDCRLGYAVGEVHK